MKVLKSHPVAVIASGASLLTHRLVVVCLLSWRAEAVSEWTNQMTAHSLVLFLLLLYINYL